MGISFSVYLFIFVRVNGNRAQEEQPELLRNG